MADTAKLGAWLIVGGFAVYIATGTASWYTDSPVFLWSFAGTLLLFIGTGRILSGLEAPKAMWWSAMGALLLASILGRMANSIVLDPGASLEEANRFVYFSTGQSLALTLAGGLALSYRGSGLVRGLCLLALAGNVGYAFLTLDQLHGLADGTRSWEGVQGLLGPLGFMDNLLGVAAVVFATSLAAPEPKGRTAPGGHPYLVPSGPHSPGPGWSPATEAAMPDLGPPSEPAGSGRRPPV